MKLSVVFPSVVYNQGREAVANFVLEVERIGFDHLEFQETTPAVDEARQKPSLDVLATLGFAAGVSSTLGLGAQYLALTNREAMLAAEQIATLNFILRGRLRLGLSLVRSETDDKCGERLDEAVALLRSYCRGETQGFSGAYYRSDDSLVTPSSEDIPIWISGFEPEALERVGRFANGWSGERAANRAQLQMAVEMIRRYAANAGRDPEAIELQFSLAQFGRESQDDFFNDRQRVVARLAELQSMGFSWVSIDLESAGHRDASLFVERLEHIYETLRID